MAARKSKRKPYKLTKEVEETILKHLRTGAFLSHACEAAGIEYRTLRYWLDRAEAGERVYKAFAMKVMKQRAENAIRSQSVITRAQLGHIDGDWKSAAWDLERKYPKEYGQAALRAAASVSIRPAGAESDNDHGASTTVQFYLPDNGRRPQDDEET